MEDGCSKRFDLAVAFNPQFPATGQSSKTVARTNSMQSPYLLASSNTMTYQPVATRPTAGLHPDFLNRPDFLGGENNQATIWTN
jgi:hypothetical protein